MPATVLCVDNDRALCDILAEALRSEGYHTTQAFDGEEALARFEEEPPDAVLLDLMLPRRDGFSVLEAIRSRKDAAQSTPVLLLTGASPTPEYRQRARSHGAVALLTKPVALEHLLALVRDHAAESKRKDRVVRPRRSDRDLSGSLEKLPFASLLHHLHGLRATGVLELGSGRKRKWIQLRDGHPVSLRSNLMSECLGNFLARSGRISQEALYESVRRMRGGRLQGEILVAMEVMREDEIAQALRAQADAKLFEIFAWGSGSFRFRHGASLARANGLAGGRSPATLILEGVRRFAPLEPIDRLLTAKQHHFLARAESPYYRFQDVRLEPDQAKLVGALDGTRRLVEFTGGAEESTRRTLFALVATGLLDLRPGPPRQAAVPPTRAAASAPTPASAGAVSPRARPPVAEETSRVALAEMAQRFAGRDCFAILGVDEDARESDVAAAYERVSQQTHPDRYAGASDAVQDLAEQVFARVTEAYETLIDPRRRAEYVLDRRRRAREVAAREEGQRALEAEMEFQKGDAALRARDYERALAHFGRALELYPGEGDHHAHYGWALYLCHPGDPSIVAEALEHVKRAIKLASHREKPYLFLGRLCKATGRIETAERMFARAVQIQPDCAEALSELRVINMRRKPKGLIKRLLRR